MTSRRSTIRCASCRATYWSDDAHRCPPAKPAVGSRAIIDDAKKRPACKTCHAAWGRPCRSKSGHVTRAHRSRVIATVNASNAKLVRDADAVLAKIAAVAAKPRRWRKVGPHEYALRMGPVTVSVIGADRTWRWHAVVEVGEVHKTSATILREWDSTPRAQCQANAIAAVERWRDGIR